MVETNAGPKGDQLETGFSDSELVTEVIDEKPNGDNLMLGKTGKDIFVYMGGQDTIMNFNKGEDRIDVSSWHMDFESIEQSTSGEGGMLLKFAPGQTVKLIGFDSSLDPSDLVFGD